MGRNSIQALFLFTIGLAAWGRSESFDRPQATGVRENGQSYYWQSLPVGQTGSAPATAQLLTLFCKKCGANNTADIPLVSVLRDTLGDSDRENDRISYVWLLTYSRSNLGQRILSAVPFFYWRVGAGSPRVNEHDTAPLLDVSAPRRPIVAEAGRDLLQWTMLDPATTPIRASSRAYRMNEVDHERLHLEEAVSYLRKAPVSDNPNAPTQSELNTVIARLELRKKLLGGFVSERRAEQVGQDGQFEQERIRSRNWELLRQCAEKTGLLFEPIDLAGTTGDYAILWFPLKVETEPAGTSLGAIWKLLNIKDPFSDDRLRNWHGISFERALDTNGTLLPPGSSGRQVKLVPLGVYSLTYPRLPLLLIDFRNKLHVRQHELTQRSINEITSGVIGISHFTNWYYYAGADFYDFYVARHGGATNQSERLDCYSQFRVALTLDRQLDPELRNEMQRRVESLAVNPLEAAPEHEMQAALARYEQLKAEAGPDGHLMASLDKERRAELATFGASKKKRVFEALLHEFSFGAYTHRVHKGDNELVALDRDRRVQYELAFLDRLVEAETPPEVAYESSRISDSVMELSRLMPRVESRAVHSHAVDTLERIEELSRDPDLRAECALAATDIRSKDIGNNSDGVRVTQVPGVAAGPHGAAPRVARGGAASSVVNPVKPTLGSEDDLK